MQYIIGFWVDDELRYVCKYTLLDSGEYSYQLGTYSEAIKFNTAVEAKVLADMFYMDVFV